MEELYRDIEWVSNIRDSLRKCKTRKISDTLYELLLSSIVTEQIPPKTKIVTSQLAKELDISMTPLRVALAQLQDIGLVQLIANKGAYIMGFNRDEIEQLTYYRVILETTAASRACMIMTDQQHQKLSALTKEIEEKTKGCEADTYLRNEEIAKADLDFHTYLVECSQNPYIIQQYKNILPKVRFVRQYIERTEISPIDFVEEHKLVCLMLKTKKPNLVISVLEHHLHNHSLIEK